MSDMIMFLSLWFFSLGISSDVSEEIYLNKTIDEYRIYALSKCIRDNHEKIGVDFKHTSVSDFTEGFIDMGLGFNIEPNSLLN